MSYRPTESLVRCGRLPAAVQIKLASDSRFRKHLIANPSLTDSAIRELMAGRLTSSQASLLYARKLSPSLRATVLQEIKETRRSALLSLAAHNTLTDEEQKLLVALPMAAQAADRLLYDDLSPATHVELTARASARGRLEWLDSHPDAIQDTTRLSDLITDALMNSYIGDDTEKPAHRRARRILSLHPPAAELVAHRAGIDMRLASVVAPLELSTAARHRVLTAAASMRTPHWSLGLVIATLAALIDRPDLSKGQVREASRMLELLSPVGLAHECGLNSGRRRYDFLPRTEMSLRSGDDHATLKGIVERFPIPGHRFRYLRAFQWAELAENPHLSDDEAKAVSSMLNHTETRKALGPYVRYRALRALADNHPGLHIRTRRPTPKTRTWPKAAVPVGVRPLIDAIAKISLSTLSDPVQLDAAARFLSVKLDDDVEAWTVALALGDDCVEPLSVLAETAASLAAA